MARAYIGLGSNQGHQAQNLKKALKLVHEAEGVEVTGVSSVYLTEPVGYEDQPWFYNCIAEVETTLSAEQLLEVLQGIENRLGRERTVRWGPRTIDLDILLYDRVQLNGERLIIPHPRMRERAFVMVPLAEIAPDACFPDGETVIEARNRLGEEKKYICIMQKVW
ncbi:MAG: 2-amino-4-hydroxy-6-hydroxymethyldihydropteridine diphosphokinase [Firmicutes bacterium HGW-Firmicutes-14]|jgi:2-amino-4-hydroxy-6-hydroxymethyldihydropteridine diphosphokinase|nr:MAG: 2-amino-4-hydroxy-6-hydroxymethyldihydropteridine diphosphokinase [Firmicutes bacterium HGW-Firmicutes-14]